MGQSLIPLSELCKRNIPHPEFSLTDNRGMPFKSTPARLVLAENVKRLKDHYRISDMPKVLVTKAHIGRGTAHRIIKGQVACRIDNLEAVAKAFQLQAWQLLVPEINPANPPTLRTIGEREEEFWKRLEELRKDFPDVIPEEERGKQK